MSESARLLTKVGMETAHRNTFYATLRRCAEGECRHLIATQCFVHATTSGDVSLVPYEVTTLYFEAENED